MIRSGMVLALLLAAATPATSVAAQEEPERERTDWAVAPLVGYTPESQLLLGGFGAYFFHEPGSATLTRPSSLALAAIYTTRSHALVELVPELFIDDERYHLVSKLSFHRAPDFFYGIGNGSRMAEEERYERETWRARLRASVRAWKRLSLGALIDFQHVDVTVLDSDGLLSQGVLGNRGGWSNGIGVLAEWDTRDNYLSAYRGSFHQFTFTRFDPVWGSDYAFSRFEIDLRTFVPLYGTHVLALQFFGQFHGGDVPFDRMALLGGSRLRGYYEGRFRDLTMITAQIEYRFPIFWRFRGAVFAGAGDVARDLGLDLLGLEASAGAGLRFLFNRSERLTLRMDFGVGLKDYGFYFGVGEAF